MKPFCNLCKDVKTVSKLVKAEGKREEYEAIPCPECMVVITLTAKGEAYLNGNAPAQPQG